MKVDMIVRLAQDKKYYLVDETIQDNTKYFLATRLDDNSNPTIESEIFEELVTDGSTYLTPVIDNNILNTLAAIFIAKFKKLMEQE